MARARTQETRQLAVATPKGDDYFLLRTLSGTEGVSTLFEYTLELLGGEDNTPYADLVGKPMTVRLELGNGSTRYFSGIVSRFAQSTGEKGRVEFRATLVPWLWLLTRRSDCRIFQGKTVPDIIKQAFRDLGLTDFEDKLDGTYREWEYCVQYRETDFAFVSRLMEQEGIYYYFRHENGKHVLVLADSTPSVKAFPGYDEIRYKPFDAVLTDYELVHTLTVERELQPGRYAHTDYDFKAPKRNLLTAAKATREGAENPFEIFDYPGEFTVTTDGEDMASVRLDEHLTRFEIARGTGDSRGIAAGCKFRLVEYRREDQNKEYLVTSTRIEASSDEFESGVKEPRVMYSVAFTAIDATQLFRAPSATPRPMIHGCQTAVVVGKSGEEIWTDEHGRVKVQFHWDRESAGDENSSCWIRVSQPWAGKKWGAINIPRIGQEVIVEFLEGDPDRPIITGRVYNGENKTPYDLPARATMTTMKTNASKGGGGFNEIRFEDKKGEEQVFVHAEKRLDIRVKEKAYEFVTKDRHEIVAENHFEEIRKNRNLKVAEASNHEVGKDHSFKVGGKHLIEVGGARSDVVKGDVAEEYKGNHAEKVTSNYYLKAQGIVLESTTGITIKCGGNSVVIDSAGVTVKGSVVTIDGSMTKINSGPGSSPASGSAGSIEAPVAPTAPEEAATADPGQVEAAGARQRQRAQSPGAPVTVTGQARPAAGQPAGAPEEAQPAKTWFEFQVLNAEGKPMKDEPVRVTLKNGQRMERRSDQNGVVRIENVDASEVAHAELTRRKQDEWDGLGAGPRRGGVPPAPGSGAGA